MTVFDYLVLGIVGASVVLGLLRGVVSEVLALAAWVLAFFAARALGSQAAELLSGVIADPMMRQGGGYFLVFLTVLLLAAAARLVFRELIKAVGLGLVDRLLGAVFGVLRGVAVVLVGVLLGGLTALPKQGWWRDAVLSPPLETLVIAGKPWLPPDVAKRIRYR